MLVSGCLFSVRRSKAAFAGMQQQWYRLEFAIKTKLVPQQREIMLGLGVTSGNYIKLVFPTEPFISAADMLSGSFSEGDDFDAPYI